MPPKNFIISQMFEYDKSLLMHTPPRMISSNNFEKVKLKYEAWPLMAHQCIYLGFVGSLGKSR